MAEKLRYGQKLYLVEIDGGHFEKWLPFPSQIKFGMALYLKMLTNIYSSIMPNLMLVSYKADYNRFMEEWQNSYSAHIHGGHIGIL